MNEFDVFIAVKTRHFLGNGLVRSVDFHFSVETVVENEIVRHSNPVGFHRMALTVVVVADIEIVVVRDFLSAMRSDGAARHRDRNEERTNNTSL